MNLPNGNRACCNTPEGIDHRGSCTAWLPKAPGFDLGKAATGEQLGLDYDDPIERACIDIVQMNRRKRADYAQDGNIFSNFEQAAFTAGTTTAQGIEYMIATKQARLVALRSNGREPQNESVYDTMLDRAVYAIIALAYAQRSETEV